jgi:hypothetical protein
MWSREVENRRLIQLVSARTANDQRKVTSDLVIVAATITARRRPSQQGSGAQTLGMKPPESPDEQG